MTVLQTQPGARFTEAGLKRFLQNVLIDVDAVAVLVQCVGKGVSGHALILHIVRIHRPIHVLLHVGQDILGLLTVCEAVVVGHLCNA